MGIGYYRGRSRVAGQLTGPRSTLSAGVRRRRRRVCAPTRANYSHIDRSPLGGTVSLLPATVTTQPTKCQISPTIFTAGVFACLPANSDPWLTPSCFDTPKRMRNPAGEGKRVTAPKGSSSAPGLFPFPCAPRSETTPRAVTSVNTFRFSRHPSLTSFLGPSALSTQLLGEGLFRE